MTESTFKRIVGNFADDLDFTRGKLTMELRDEIKEIELVRHPNGTRVHMDGETLPAEYWIYKHLAKLDFLARRIRDLVEPPEHFVAPTGKLLDNIDKDPIGNDQEVSNAAETVRTVLGSPIAGTTSVLYLTSEAGEGKTSIINKVAVLQAEAYLEKTTDWLLLPVSLGGRPFLRFDDAVIAALVNNLRFPFWYYEAFLDLVRLGAILPAFDGFEEMIVGTRFEEAQSAFSNLVRELRSQGSLLVAARRAFFDLSFGKQVRLWMSSTRDDDVQTQRLSLNRWDEQVFLDYARKRSVPEPANLYAMAEAHLRNKDHPVLTRAVLVKRLIDVALDSDGLSGFLARIGNDKANYFYDFVEGIVEREVEHKWRDTSGGGNAKLLSLDQHHQLLSSVALEMWMCSVDVLGLDMIDMVVELFVEDQDLSPVKARHIFKRIADHSLLHSFKRNGRDVINFDHDDFRSFYLGQALGRALIADDKFAVKQILDAKSLSAPVIAEATRLVSHADSVSISDVLSNLFLILEGAHAVSYIRENCGMLGLALLHNSKEVRAIERVSFALDALAGRHLSNLTVRECYLAETSLKETRLENCVFDNCRFARLVVHEPLDVDDSVLSNCQIDSVIVLKDSGRVRTIFDPLDIQRELREYGFQIAGPTDVDNVAVQSIENEEDLELSLKFFSMFLRATSLPKPTIQTRFGKRSGYFIGRVLPKLQKEGVVGDFARSNRRMKLLVPIEQIEQANRQAKGSFERFVSAI